MKIGAWNVTTLKNDHCIDILIDAFRRFELLGVSETHIPGVRSNKLGDIEFVLLRKEGWGT